jgi:CHORD
MSVRILEVQNPLYEPESMWKLFERRPLTSFLDWDMPRKHKPHVGAWRLPATYLPTAPLRLPYFESTTSTPSTMKVILHYEEPDDLSLHKSLKITLPKSWNTGPISKLLGQFVESYNAIEELGGTKNPLDASNLHLGIRKVQGDGSSGTSAMSPLPSDAVVIDTIPDRADVYVRHGPSRTLQEIEQSIQEEKARLLQEKQNTVACTRFGCKNRFPRGGPYPECRYHKAPPVFHETAKFWSCCPHKKAYDWEDFQSIPGCQTGVCTDVKDDAGGKQFLGGSDLREQAVEAVKLKSIDDFNKAQAAGGSDAAPVLERLQQVLQELGVERELFDQVVDGYKAQLPSGSTDAEILEHVKAELGKKLKDTMKTIAAQHLRIS